MVFPILVRLHLYIESGARWTEAKLSSIGTIPPEDAEGNRLRYMKCVIPCILLTDVRSFPMVLIYITYVCKIKGPYHQMGIDNSWDQTYDTHDSLISIKRMLQDTLGHVVNVFETMFTWNGLEIFWNDKEQICAFSLEFECAFCGIHLVNRVQYELGMWHWWYSCAIHQLEYCL